MILHTYKYYTVFNFIAIWNVCCGIEKKFRSTVQVLVHYSSRLKQKLMSAHANAHANGFFQRVQLSLLLHTGTQTLFRVQFFYFITYVFPLNESTADFKNSFLRVFKLRPFVIRRKYCVAGKRCLFRV